MGRFKTIALRQECFMSGTIISKAVLSRTKILHFDKASFFEKKGF